ncbi:MAG: hypothetical protein ABI724_13365 [Betaproteobacteria bacterium]
MGIAIAHLAPFQPAVRCRICQREASRGAKLCSECAAAVKRARHVPTVTSQFLPQRPSRPDWAHRKAERTPVSASTARLRAWLPTRPGGWGALAAFAIFGALVCVTGYYAVQEIDYIVAHPGMTQSAVATPMPPPLAAAAPAESTETWMFAKPPDTEAPGPLVTAAIPDPSGAALPVPKPAARKTLVDARAAKAPVTMPDTRLASRSGEADTISLPRVEVNPAPVASSVARAPTQEEAPAPSRWDTLNAAMARCTGEGLLAGIVCTERARLQYCDGYWGTVPQCKGASAPDASR